MTNSPDHVRRPAAIPGEARLPRVQRPCSECPWRRDQPTGRFTAERFESLRNTVEGPDGSAPIGAPLFACHRTPPDVPSACAGWLAVEGSGHVGVRLAVVSDRLDPAALTPAPGWPDLYESFDEMCRANGDGLHSVTRPRPPRGPYG